ncbi:MAG: helix-turn-helix transcriptional regulator [Saprospiraceae bacterium]|nr:helix-turn-helix transcriptional regulator [Saprospiraceae bacterium]
MVLRSGKTFNVAFDLDPIVLYENSEPDVKRNERYKIGRLIKEEREKAGITQQELAIKSGTTRNYISRIENNKSDIELRTLRKIIELGFGKELELAVK